MAATRLNVGHLSSLESFPKAACRQHQPRWQLRTLATTPCDRRAAPPREWASVQHKGSLQMCAPIATALVGSAEALHNKCNDNGSVSSLERG